ncbi:DNA repair ATPase [Kiritimatiellota bacterium B12222]|nr:DNA repair ATPase [Kiritimatiellota bacterium B12222]
MPDSPEQPEAQTDLSGGAYEIIRRRLHEHGDALRERIDQLNNERQKVFGGVEPKLVGTERVLTANNCVPRDMVALGDRFLFGYNVQLGLKTEMDPKDVFAIFTLDEHGLTEIPLPNVLDDRFIRDFKELYTFYRDTRFAKFAVIGPHLYMIFRVGKEIENVKTFKWLMNDDGSMTYIDNRSDHEYKYPPQHEFEWVNATRDMQRNGAFPHISFEDRIFVETTGGDLTVKVDDNTETGEGIYAEPVDNPDQTLDDAEFAFASVGNLILMRILPYQEKEPRYLVYSEKVRQARRMDAIAGACVLLPEDHGIIFSNGYYLQTGEFKEFDSGLKDMMFERRIASPNGEDSMYVFYNRTSGSYVLLSYNIITQKVETPIECSGFCLFSSGRLMYFKAQEEPTKSHIVQIWQTPYAESVEGDADAVNSMLFKIGNRDVVRCMAGCGTLMGLLNREDSYANLYVDIVRQSTDLIDSYFWIRESEAFNLGEPLDQIRNAASSAIAEYEKVVQLRHAAENQLKETDEATRDLLNQIRLQRQDEIQGFVQALGSLRGLRGKVIALKDVRYMDLETVSGLEETVKEHTEQQARRCVDFLLGDKALAPYEKRIANLEPRIPDLKTVRDGESMREEVEGISGELEMLIEIVGNLSIDDATQRTQIIDGISALFSTLNQVRASLQNRIKKMAVQEGEAEFSSQMKLLNQSVINYLDVCDSPEKCEQSLSRVMIQLEELEGKFADYDEYVLKLGEKREEVYNAFETRRLSLVEARNKRADTLQRSAERILGSVKNRVGAMKTVEEIHGYYASDMMIEKLRGIIDQLTDMGDPVKAGDIETQLKGSREDAVRQLHDRSELFVDGENVIQFGRHKFSVNTQELDLTIVPRDDEMMLHLTGTAFFESITDPDFLATRPVWSQKLISENDEVARVEYLAYSYFISLGAAPAPEDLASDLKTFMAPRYAEGYQKGVHDEDATQIVSALLDMRDKLGTLRTPAAVRALAVVYWEDFRRKDEAEIMIARLKGVGASNQVFRQNRRQADAVNDLARGIKSFAEQSDAFDPRAADNAAAYLFDVVANGIQAPVSAEGGKLILDFQTQLKKLGSSKQFESACASLRGNAEACFGLVREWLQGYLENKNRDDMASTLDEAAAWLSTGVYDPQNISDLSEYVQLNGMRSAHARIVDGNIQLQYSEFMWRLERFEKETVPRFKAYERMKKEFVENSRKGMRLDEFKPRVLTSFVRNKLIDRVYLPIVGDNLAKQIGVVGKNTRTDRSGMLMLISPPGYGKTTLMEYIANRLGVVFMKINGPAIGHLVTSLDPAEAPNAAAREELNKLGLALEMGDNVMLYLDDIQHCNPEFLQKFISLCDAQRKIEGVYKGISKTYDLRGKKVSVVMAGNPYTESGEKFRIPDMLANRADTYNLGDILGDNGADFELSFLENALTSNPALNRLASGVRKDVHAIIRAAENGQSEGVELEGRYTGEEVSEMLSVMRKMITIRDVLLKVNAEYIHSAGQADDYRTEPAFKLQGSYRNMARLSEKVEAVMNDRELQTLIVSDYENEAQTLTTGAEANLLKFKELIGIQTEAEQERWEEIKKGFVRNQVMKGVGGDDRVGQAVAQLSVMGEGLADIGKVLKDGVGSKNTTAVETRFAPDTLEQIEKWMEKPKAPSAPSQTGLSKETLDQIGKLIAQLQPITAPQPAPSPERNTGLSPALAKMLEQQFERLQECVQDTPAKPEKILAKLERAKSVYNELMNQVGYGGGHDA